MNRTLAIPAAVPVTTSALPAVTLAKSVQQRVPATQHRFVAGMEAQVGLSGKTRVLRATDEARDVNLDASAVISAATAKDEARVPPAEDSKLSSNVTSGNPERQPAAPEHRRRSLPARDCPANPLEQALRCHRRAW